MTLSPSDVVMIPFPYTDLKTSKRRPVLVLRAADEYGDFLGVFLSRAICRKRSQHHNGRLDCVVKTDKHNIFVIEFKLNQRAKVTLQHIKDKGYVEKYLADSRQKVLLRVNFSSENKAVRDWLADELI